MFALTNVVRPLVTDSERSFVSLFVSFSFSRVFPRLFSIAISALIFDLVYLFARSFVLTNGFHHLVADSERSFVSLFVSFSFSRDFPRLFSIVISALIFVLVYRFARLSESGDSSA